MTATTVVLAGGRGTRVEALTAGVTPKALLDVAGRPFVDRKLAELRDNGVSEVVVLAGHAGAALDEHLREHPVAGLDVTVIFDGERLLGTGGAVAAALEHLPDVFWVTYGDTLLEVAMAPIESSFLRADAAGLLVVVHNRDHVQTSNTSIEEGRVIAYSKGGAPGTHEYLDYGLLLLRRRAFDGFTAGDEFDLGDVLRALVERRSLLAHVVQASFYDVGTPDAWRATSEHYRSG
jgi:NDP-sugar pyrophosphorylase family protein